MGFLDFLGGGPRGREPKPSRADMRRQATVSRSNDRTSQHSSSPPGQASAQHHGWGHGHFGHGHGQQQQGPPVGRPASGQLQPQQSMQRMSPQYPQQQQAGRPPSPRTNSAPRSGQMPPQQQQASMQHAFSARPAQQGMYPQQSMARQVPLPVPGSQSGGSFSDQQVRDLQHKVSVLEAQVHEVDELKHQLAQQQGAAEQWRERWNMQNLKLNLMVDMMVLRVLEAEGGGPAAAQLATPATGEGATAVQAF